MYEYKLVKTWQDANILLSKGFKLRRIDRDKFDRAKLIFWFDYEEGLDEELNIISKKKKELFNK